MGYNVAVMADSTSRWAEALREISGRLEEMPAEEGFPAYLPSKLSAFYERAGLFETLSGKQGSITIIGAVSPQGNDFSEPVTQNTKRFIRCYWALDKSLAYSRHYPAVNWLDSYSEYLGELEKFYNNKFGENYSKYRLKIQSLLNEESSLMEIVKLIGSDLLADEQKLILDIARVIRVGFLQQNAMHPTDSFVSTEKQYNMMKFIIMLYEQAKILISRQIPASVLRSSGVYEILCKMKYDIPNTDNGEFEEMWKSIKAKLSEIESQYA
jgi:V/A-type H+-transporting ATPase subunit A